MTSLSPEAFVLRALEVLPEKGKSGFHTVFSGFNAAFRKTFPDVDVVTLTKTMAAEGKISVRPAKRGAWLSKPNGTAPIDADQRAAEVLKKIGV